MRSEKWLKVEEMLDAALEVEPARRPKLLDELCASEPDLRREVESLLSCDEGVNNFLAVPAIAFSADFFNDRNPQGTRATADTLAGQRIGQYQLIREIGHGGMGTVYLARRADDEYRKFVALKIVRRGMDTEDIVRRFRNERQILAALEHPNIARLLDGGATENDLPYLVMEYVEGLPITDYCDKERLSTHERLELFRTVCAAVQHAHQNLVVHRDLKPSNILITPEGTPKLLDFGIAKVLNPELSALSMEQTRTELRVLTPDYASPEQVRGEKLTTASDVYSLGVVLYELLAGHRPYHATRAPSHELARVICEQEPARPSTAVNNTEVIERADTRETISITPESVSRARNTQPEKLRRSLSGDLDNIILMALRKEPKRRYESAAALSADIERHINGLPVIARKDTFKYRTTKFVQRNRLAVAAAALVLLSLIGGIVVSLWQVRRANELARIAAHERDRARVEAAKAERINSFLQNVLGYSQVSWLSPNPQRKTVSTISEALDEASRRAERELADQPEILAAVQFSLGQSYASQGAMDVAAQHFRASIENRRRALGPEHPDTAQSMTALGEMFLYQGKFAEAESISREAAAIYRRASERGEVNRMWFAYSFNILGSALISKGDAPGGEAALLEAVKIGAGINVENRGMIAAAYGNLAISRGNQGDVDGAVAYLHKALEELRRLPDEPTANVALVIGNLGSFMTIKGEYARAEQLLLESLDIHSKTVGEKHQFTTWAINFLADNYYAQGDYRRALEEVNRALAIQREVLPEGNIDFSRSWNILGKILTRTGDLKGGESHLRRALELRAKALKPGHWRLAETQLALGENLTAQKRYSEAEPFLLDSFRSLESSLSLRDPRTKEALRRLVTLYEAWGKPEAAAEYRNKM